MQWPMSRGLQVSLFGALCLWAAQAGAQIVIGQTAGFTGPVAGGVKETSDGAHLYIDSINAKGGVNGEAVELVSLDDKFEPKQAEANARELITKRNVVAMFLTRGTPHTQAVVPLLNEHHVALIGPATGAMAMHQPVQPYVFNVRSAYQREAERAVRHLSLIGLTRIAVLQVDDSFGSDVIIGAQAGFAATDKKPVSIEKFDRAQKDFGAIAARVAKEDAQAVLFIGSGQIVADGVAALRAAGSRAQIVTTSNNASADFIRQLGANAHGTIITQVFPYERSLGTPIVKEALELASAKNVSVTPGVA